MILREGMLVAVRREGHLIPGLVVTVTNEHILINLGEEVRPFGDDRVIPLIQTEDQTCPFEALNRYFLEIIVSAMAFAGNETYRITAEMKIQMLQSQKEFRFRKPVS